MSKLPLETLVVKSFVTQQVHGQHIKGGATAGMYCSVANTCHCGGDPGDPPP